MTDCQADSIRNEVIELFNENRHAEHPEKLDFSMGGSSTISACGSSTTEVRRLNHPQATTGKAGGLPSNANLATVNNNILSNETIEKKPKRSKRTRNRKKTTNKQHHLFEGNHYEVNTGGGKYEVYPQIIDGIIERLTVNKRSFAFHFGLHQKDYQTETSKMISQFFDRLKKRLRTQYSGIGAIHYVWVREEENAKAQHYHVALILNYDVVRSSYKTGEIIREVWASIRDGNSARIHNGTHQVKDDNSLRNAIYHLSYLAKERGKGYRPAQSKDYGKSLLKRK